MQRCVWGPRQVEALRGIRIQQVIIKLILGDSYVSRSSLEGSADHTHRHCIFCQAFLSILSYISQRVSCQPFF
jgi:hypothetical protein